MKSNPFAKVLAPFLKCVKCGSTPVDPTAKLCRECEISKLIKTKPSGRAV